MKLVSLFFFLLQGCMELIISRYTLSAVYNNSNVSLRLVGGYDSYEGRVEVYYNGQWGTICDDSWDDSDAEVVCHQLGMSGEATAVCCGLYGHGVDPIWLDDVECIGSENNIASCGIKEWGRHNCFHNEDAGVRCTTVTEDDVNVRLVGGYGSSEGRVEVFYRGQWGTICDDSWDDNAAAVVCRQLGFNDSGTAICCGQYGRGVGPIWLDDVECDGSENSIMSCTNGGFGIHNCGHSEDAGVRCRPGNVSLRLVGGYDPSEGRVEVFYNGQWGTICDDSWDENDASVVCRQLGLNGSGTAICCGQYGQGVGPIWLDDVECEGSEISIMSCINRGFGIHNCGHSEDAGVQCGQASNEGRHVVRIRLAGEQNHTEGRVEVYYNGQWGTICDDYWDDNDALVVCRQLGINGSATAVSHAGFGQGAGPIWFDDVECVGSERDISYCGRSAYFHNCGHSEDAGVRCGNDLGVRLIGGSGSNEGRVEVYHAGEWGTICDDSWDDYDAAVVCRQLGLGNGTAVCCGEFGQSTAQIWMDGVTCHGTESNIGACGNNGWGNHNCLHRNDAGVRCHITSASYRDNDDKRKISSPGYPNSYPPFEFKTWELFSESGFLLEIVRFSLQSIFDILVIQNGPNVSDIFVEKNLSGSLDADSVYVFDWSYLRMTFISDSLVQDSGFSFNVLDADTSSKVTCNNRLIPQSEFCNSHIFCENAVDEENCTVPLQEGNVAILSSAGYPDNYSPSQHEKWSFWTKRGYLLTFVDFQLVHGDLLLIYNGHNASHIHHTVTLMDKIYTAFDYVFELPYLQLVFRSDEYGQGTGFQVEVLAKQISSQTYCDGLGIPDYERCNFHVFCNNAFDEEDCHDNHIEPNEPIVIPSLAIPNVYHRDGEYIYNEWRLSSLHGFQINVTFSSIVDIYIENSMKTGELFFLNRILGSLEQGVSYAFDLPQLRIIIRLLYDHLIEEVSLTSSELVTKFIGDGIGEHNLRFEIFTKNATLLKDCTRVCPSNILTASTGEIHPTLPAGLDVHFNCICEWNITVRSNFFLQLNVTSMNLPCDLVHLEILAPANDRMPPQQSGLCGTESGLILTEGNMLILKLKINTGDKSQFFKARYQEIVTPGCGTLPFNKSSTTRRHICTRPTAFIASANYPLQFEAGLVWFWDITTTASTYIEVKFVEFDVKSLTNDCEEDNLEFKMKASTFRLCNANIGKNTSYFSDINKLTIKLSSKRNSVGGTFFGLYFERYFVSAVGSMELEPNLKCMDVSPSERQHCFCLFRHPHNISWLDASAECQKFAGGYLANIRSQQDMDFIQHLILKQKDPSPRTYIGLTWDVTEKRFVWSNGYPLSFTDWKISRDNKERQPDGGGEEHCTMISLWSNRETKNWADIPCDEPLTSQFLCQRDDILTGNNNAVEFSSAGSEDEGIMRNDQFQCFSGERILKVFECDGNQDCFDNSDESSCVNVKGQESYGYFTCKTTSRIFATFYCDYKEHCKDKSDEYDCDYPQCSVNEIGCGNHLCIPQDKVCDLKQDCWDGLDEKDCDESSVKEGYPCSSDLVLPARRRCDGHQDCPRSQRQDESEDCDYFQDNFRCDSQSHLKCKRGTCAEAESRCIFEYDEYGYLKGCRDATHLEQCETFECHAHHFKCPSSYCIPERYRCNKKLDCPYGEDEVHCDSYKCAAGSYKCHGSYKGTPCLPQYQVCDGTFHCPERDDELYCDAKCPDECSCVGLSFDCSFAIWDKGKAENLPKHLKEIIVADLYQSNGNQARASLTIYDVIFTNFTSFRLLLRIDLSGNRIQIINEKEFLENKNLRELYLSRNHILAVTKESFRGLHQLQILNLSGNPLTGIGNTPFKLLSNLEVLFIEATDIPSNKENIFAGLVNLQKLYSDEFHFCCLESSPPEEDCYPKAGPFSGCENLMQNSFLRMCLWLLGISAVVGNGFVIILRIRRRDVFPGRDRNPVQGILILNLAAADFFTGMYLIIIAFADLAYDNVYYRHSESWQTGALCTFAGFLVTLGSEASVIFLTVITVDRFQMVVFPFSKRKLQFKSTIRVVLCVWVIAFVISALPLISFKHFYGRSSVCLALPLTNEKRQGWFYSVFVFLIFNFLSFVAMFAFYCAMYLKARKSIKFGASVSSKPRVNTDKQVEMAMRMFSLVATDMACWMPIILMGFLAQTGAVTVSSGVYAWTAVLILPVNSSLNPYLYTMMIKATTKTRQNQSSTDYSQQLSAIESREFQKSIVHKDAVVLTDRQRALSGESRQTRLILTLTPGGIGKQSLAMLMEEQPSSVTGRVKEIIKRDLLKALQSLHSNGLIHGKVSAENVIIDKGPEYQIGAFLLYTPASTPTFEAKVESYMESFEDLKQRDLQSVEEMVDIL